MSYTIDKHLTKTNKGSKGRNNPQWIVVHFVGASGQAWDNAKYFHSTYRGASAHYFVDPNNIVQVVEDDTPSWAIGDGSRTGKGKYNGYVGYGATNNNNISIEMCQDTSTGTNAWNWQFHDDTVDRTEWLIKQKQKEHNIPDSRVIRHYDASGKLCPGNWKDNNWAKWWDFKDRLAGIKDVKPSGKVSSNDGKPKVEGKTHTVESGETLSGIAKKHGVSLKNLIAWNDIENADLIFPETVLFVEEPKAIEPEGDIDELALEVLAGKYGSGDKRKESLGKLYDDVQARVNEILLGGSKPAPKKKTVAKVGKGSKVTLKTSAKKYATGEKIPSSVKGKRYTVQQVRNNGSQVLLKEIMSWVYTKDVSTGGATSKSTSKKFNLPTGTYKHKTPMMNGSDVKVIQEALASIYFYPNKRAKNNGVDGWYGADTANAVQRFQSMYGLTEDGIYGSRTRAELDRRANK